MKQIKSQTKQEQSRQSRLLKYSLSAKTTLLQGLLVTGLTVASSLLAPYLVKYLLDNELRAGAKPRANFLILILVAYLGTVLLGSHALFQYLTATQGRQ